MLYESGDLWAAQPLVNLISWYVQKLGSDHLPLAAEFAFIQCDREENEVIT